MFSQANKLSWIETTVSKGAPESGSFIPGGGRRGNLWYTDRTAASLVYRAHSRFLLPKNKNIILPVSYVFSIDHMAFRAIVHL